mgnify:CR=1 FL=1
MGLGINTFIIVRSPKTDLPGVFGRISPPSLSDCLQEPPVVLADFSRLFEGPCALFIQTPKVSLNIPDIEFEVTSDDIGKLFGRLRIAWNKWPLRRVTGFGGSTSGPKYQQKYSLHEFAPFQPKGVKTPRKLDQTHITCLTLV